MSVTLEKLAEAHLWLQRLRPLPSDVVDELRHRFEVSLTHHSTAIEGNTLSQSETQIVIEKGITLSGKSLSEHLEVVGHKEALDFVIDLAEDTNAITERDIREIHALVMKGQVDTDRGLYRTLDVKAAGTEYVYPSHLKVLELMTEFVAWLSQADQARPVEFASEAHARFVTIHPFRDGNGRVGRLLMNLILLRKGYTIAVVRLSERAEYIAALEAVQSSGDRQALDRLVCAAVGRSLRETLETALSSASVRLSDSDKVDISQLIIQF